jgi:hypothetical protein
MNFFQGDPKFEPPKKKYPYMPFFIALVSLIIILAISIFVSSPQTPKKDILRPETITTINAMILPYSPHVMGVQVSALDIQTNSRVIVYTHLLDSTVEKIYLSSLAKNNYGSYPIFTKDNNPNERVIRLLNHEFVCVDFQETLIFKIAPELGGHVQYICSISIPPSYGEFKGLVTLFLDTPPTDDDQLQYQALIKEISQTVSDDIN